MPATSKVQRRAMAIAEHHPEDLHERNKGMTKMSKSQLHDFASTKEKGLPKRKGSEPIKRFMNRRNKKEGKG